MAAEKFFEPGAGEAARAGRRARKRPKPAAGPTSARTSSTGLQSGMSSRGTGVPLGCSDWRARRRQPARQVCRSWLPLGAAADRHAARGRRPGFRTCGRTERGASAPRGFAAARRSPASRFRDWRRLAARSLVLALLAPSTGFPSLGLCRCALRAPRSRAPASSGFGSPGLGSPALGSSALACSRSGFGLTPWRRFRCPCAEDVGGERRRLLGARRIVLAQESSKASGYSCRPPSLAGSYGRSRNRSSKSRPATCPGRY